MQRLATRIGNDFDAAAIRQDGGAGRILRGRVFGTPGRYAMLDGYRAIGDYTTASVPVPVTAKRVALSLERMNWETTAGEVIQASLEVSLDGSNWTRLATVGTKAGVKFDRKGNESRHTTLSAPLKPPFLGAAGLVSRLVVSQAGFAAGAVEQFTV